MNYLFESQRRIGSTFIIRLFTTVVEKMTLLTEEEACAPKNSAICQRLVIDSGASVRNSLKRYLTQQGFDLGLRPWEKRV